MKNIVKFLVFALSAGVCALTSVRAADAPTATTPGAEAPEQHIRKHDKERGERLAKELGLTADQQTKMKALHQQQREAMKAVRADTTLSKEQKQAKVRDLRKDFENQRRALLTPEQQAKAKELREKLKERRQQRHDDDDDEAPPAPKTI